jgi:hypothetical protein
MEIFSVILLLLLIPLLCLLAPVLLVGLLGVMVAFALKRGQRIYVEIPRQPTGKRKNDHYFFQHDNPDSGSRGSRDEFVIVDEDGNPYRS